MNETTNNQRILDNHGNITQKGNIYDFNNLIINNYNYAENEKYIDFYKKITKESKSFEIIVLTDMLDLNMQKEYLFSKIEEFVYSSYDYKLCLITYNQKHNYKLSRNEMIHDLKIISELEKFIMNYKKDFLKTDILVSYTKLCNLMSSLNEIEIKDEINLEYEREEKATKLVDNYISNKLCSIDEIESEHFFSFLLKNNVEYIIKSFMPNNIYEFLQYKIKNSILDWGWESIYEINKDLDFKIMQTFLFRQKEYQIDITGLKHFILDKELKSIMYKDIDGENPSSLYDICKKKSRNENNCFYWEDLQNIILINDI